MPDKKYRTVSYGTVSEMTDELTFWVIFINYENKSFVNFDENDPSIQKITRNYRKQATKKIFPTIT